MSDNTALPTSKPATTRRWLLPVIVLLAAVLVSAYLGHVQRSAPARLFQAGVEAFAQNDPDAVQTAAEALQGVEGYGPHAHVLEGMILLRRGRLFEAITQFGYGKDHPDTRVLAYALSGEALYKGRQFRDAERILSTAIRLDPSQTDAHRWLAALYYDIGAMGRALEQLRAVADQAPDDPRPHRLRGLIHKDFENYAEAVNDYRESLRRGPDQPDKNDVLVELAECLVKLRRHPEALETLGQCPRSAETLSLQAECQYAQGDAARAQAARRSAAA